MTKYSLVISLVFVFLFQNIKAQSTIDSIQLEKEFVNLEKALEHPEDVYRLNLSNQDIQVSDTVWSNFTNLQYLSLKNDHLKQIPPGVGSLKNLKVLDLSGNDFEVLPSSFANLTNLEELFLNDDKYLNFGKNIPILSVLPNLTSLHIENDDLKSLPQNINTLTHLESLYLNNNHLKQIPTAIGNLKTLRVLDLSGNDFEVLPSSFANLTNLQELFLNDDKYLNFGKNIPILSALPNLTSLHLENDGLKSLPKDIFRLSHLESLFINNNQFKKLPKELKSLKELHFVDVHGNKFKLPKQDMSEKDFGLRVRF